MTNKSPKGRMKYFRHPYQWWHSEGKKGRKVLAAIRRDFRHTKAE